MDSKLFPTATHWGNYTAEVADGRVIAMHPSPGDPDPSPIGQSYLDAQDDAARIRQPMIRAGFLERGHAAGGAGRGAEPFVAVPWNEALDIAARELARVKTGFGNKAIYAGAYGWASAGRFHHAQSQMRRFLNLFGGHVWKKNSYSLAAAGVILPHVMGNLESLLGQMTPWPTIAAHGELIVAFGGLPLKNAQVNSGLVSRHVAAEGMRQCRANGIEFVNISPLRDDIPDWCEPEWLPIVPNSDVALMLALAHTLVADGAHDRAFLERCCVGYAEFEPYLLGATDGQPKTPEWAAPLTGIPAATIRDLARRMARQRTLISVAWSLQRADNGEQPFWMAIVLAAMLGQIGLPGGGVGFGYNAVNGIGNAARQFEWAALPVPPNEVAEFIPVSRIADMLLEPGSTIDYDGERLTLPDIRLIYWVGGNPFHHHQDINRLIAAWRRPETVIVHEAWWNGVARHADIVLPVSTTLERNDIGAAFLDNNAVAMHRATAPVGEARSEFEIFSGLAARLGFRERFTENRGEMEWLRHLYDISRQRISRHGIAMPDFDEFWRAGGIDLPAPEGPQVMLSAFRGDPARNALPTPSGKIEIFSSRIAGFRYADCPGHPVWRAPKEWLGAPLAAAYALHLVTNQPKTRLHSQLDNGKVSRASKINGREPIVINSRDAAARGIASGDIVRVFNGRGAILAGAIVSDGVRPNVVQLATGAWYDPLEQGRIGTLDKHGSANVLTRDEGCSPLSQGPSALSTLVEIERFDGPVPPISAFDPPPTAPRTIS